MRFASIDSTRFIQFNQWLRRIPEHCDLQVQRRIRNGWTCYAHLWHWRAMERTAATMRTWVPTMRAMYLQLILKCHHFVRTAIECDELPEVFENAKILSPNGTSFGARAEVSCPPGFRPNGSHFISCLASGQWSDALSACIRDDTTVTTPVPGVTQSKTKSTSRRPPRPSSRYTTPATSSTDYDDGMHCLSLLYPLI